MLAHEMARYRAEVVTLMGLADPQAEGFSFADCEAQLERVQKSYDDAKVTLLRAGAELRAPVLGVIDIVEQNSRIRRMARQMVKAIANLSEVYVAAELSEPKTDPAAPDAMIVTSQ
jgi:hypothetical protein